MGVAMWTVWRLAPVSLMWLATTIAKQQDVEEYPLLMPKVKPSQAESYLCTPIRLDTEATYYVTGFKPNATKMTAHHMLIYGCEEPGADVAAWNCGEMAAAVEPDMEQRPVCGPGSQSQIIYAWAMDAPGLQLPEGVGFRVGGDTSDTVAARCTMVNTRDTVTYVGATNEDEMCNFYIMYWVHGNAPMEKNTCFTPGPPSWSWGGWQIFGGGLKNIPDREASTL